MHLQMHYVWVLKQMLYIGGYATEQQRTHTHTQGHHAHTRMHVYCVPWRTKSSIQRARSRPPQAADSFSSYVRSCMVCKSSRLQFPSGDPVIHKRSRDLQKIL